MSKIKLSINRMSDSYSIYVYRSKNADDINTIEKVRGLTPVIKIDEAVVPGNVYNLYDSPESDSIDGVTYNGPAPTMIMGDEYENIIEVKKYNNYTYYNTMELKPLPIRYNGIMFYYSMLGVNESMGTITHLSKVNGILVDTSYQIPIRHIYACEDTSADVPMWEYVASAEHDSEIIIGDINDNATYDKYGNPFVNTIKPIERVDSEIRDVITRNLIVLEIQNPWQNNNIDFNYRKLKSYKVQNVIDSTYSTFSEPTYQSVLPVSIEKMLIFISKEDIDITPDNYDEEKCDLYQVIRRDGIFYNSLEHKKLGLNKYNIPLGEKLAVFNEASKQSDIKIQIPAKYGNIYYVTIYLMDIYRNYSVPKKVEIRT